MCYTPPVAEAGKYLSIFIPDKLMKRIEKFRYRQKIPSRVQAIRTLVGHGLILSEPVKKKREMVKTDDSQVH